MPLNPELNCPTTGELCPNRQLLQEMYTYEEVTDIDSYSILTDLQKLSIKLKEHEVVARVISCEGPTESECPTRDAMSESKIRIGLVKTIRTLIHR